MTAYYNEIDPYAAQWLRNLIEAGHIARGDVDERSIVDVRADELRGYTQCHFFAGIGGWSVALRLAGWDDDRPVWTGSCPCQPFSAAGAGKAADDSRHLWPAWFPLIRERRPAIVFGEQVEAAIGWGWLDAVFADLESEGYACGASVLPACGVGAPHIRNRLWFVAEGMDDATSARRAQTRRGQPEQPRGRRRMSAERSGARSLAYSDGGDASAEGLQRGGEYGQRAPDGSAGVMGNADGSGSQGRRIDRNRADEGTVGSPSVAGELDNAISLGRGAQRDDHGRNDRLVVDAADPLGGFWRDAEWIACTDGKSRPVGPGSFPLGHGIQRRTSKLRAYGNAIVPQVAAEFIGAAMRASTFPSQHQSSPKG